MTRDSKVLKPIMWIYYSRLLKKKVFCITALFSFLTVSLFLSLKTDFICSLSFLSFPEMSSNLVPRESKHMLPFDNFCFHPYEKQFSTQRIEVNLSVNDLELTAFIGQAENIAIGGAWTPTECWSKYRVNIVIPYRQRQEQLRVFLHYFHRYLPLQQIAYRIIVIEQSAENEFNRGKLFNVGFVESEKRFPSDCYIFHDVDLIPQSLNNIYACTGMPRHLSSAVDTFNYQLPYCGILGGVVAMRSHHFRKVNGYSNMFYGWGGEDDNLYFRVSQAGLNVIRFEPDVAKYKMVRHIKEIPNPSRFQIMEMDQEIYSAEGLNNLNYTLLSYELKPLYTRIFVHV
uniref:Beta-1,4-N-acetylgalactosaminyltransferase n=1 Tax=Daphnia magna TaxID=35525 RepID=A0A0P6DTX1_9CRUS